MKKVYLAYFDLMGFKEFIYNNDDETLIRRMKHIFSDIESSIGLGNYQKPKNGILLADISKSRLNCLNISDTILIWTNDCKIESLKELINVSYEFNWRINTSNFPMRGAVVKGKISEVTGRNINSKGGSYSVQCVYGEAMVGAHLKAENQNWAGTVIDISVVNDIISIENGIDFLKQYSLKYNVPYKTGKAEEYVFKLKKGKLNAIALDNFLSEIDRIFAMDNKGITESVIKKIENTKKFIVDCKDIE